MPTSGTGYSLATVSAFWLGILTSISPCPLATNIAAISFVSRKSGRPASVVMSGLFYATGRMLAYVLLGLLIIGGILSVPSVSFFLQKYMHLVLGPLLIVVGMVLLDLLTIPVPSVSPQFLQNGHFTKRLSDGGPFGSSALGFVFALAFCPISAALYFGSLMPLAMKHSSPVGLAALYGFGSAVPVLIFAVTLASSSKAAAKLFNQVTAVEKWIRIITGGLILLIGVYFCLTYIFKIL